MKNSLRLLAALSVSSVVFFTCGGEGALSRRRETASVLGRRDALSANVVISQVYGGGGNMTGTYATDYIELFNRGTTAVNLNGMSVQYAASTGSSWNPTLLPNVMLQPGQYFLIAEQTSPVGSGGVAALPLTADLTDNIAIAAVNGKVALVNGTMGLTGTCPTGANIIDFIGYGNANCNEGAASAVGTPTTAQVRNGGGCAETDNNANDFTVVAPVVRNTSSTRNACQASDAGVDAGRPDAGGGMDASCIVFATWPYVDSAGGYDFSIETTYAELYTQVPSQSDGGLALVTLEAYYGNGTLSPPQTEMYSAASDYASCDICPILRRGCDSTGVCARRYFAQAGSATVTRADQDEFAGQLIGSLSNITFREWDFPADAPVPNGECVQLGSLNVNVSWDAGVGPVGGGGGTGGGGGATGGGAGGGGATGGGAGGGGATGGGAGGGGAMTGGGSGTTGGGGGRPPRADAGTGGGAGGAGGGTAGGGTAMGGGSGATGGGSGSMGGGAAGFGGGVATGGGGGGGGLKGTSGCSCSSEVSLAFPLLMLLGVLRARRR